MKSVLDILLWHEIQLSAAANAERNLQRFYEMGAEDALLDKERETKKREFHQRCLTLMKEQGALLEQLLVDCRRQITGRAGRGNDECRLLIARLDVELALLKAYHH